MRRRFSWPASLAAEPRSRDPQGRPVLEGRRPFARPGPLEVEKLTSPEGVTLPSYDTLELVPLGGGRYDVRLSPGDSAPRLSRVDLGLLIPLVPRLARSNESLTRLALIRENFISARQLRADRPHRPLLD